jgi:trigger factor
MQVTAEPTNNPCQIVLDISVDEEQVTRTFDQTYREFSRYVNVPGFRPGKAPRAVLERYVNQDRVRQQALERIIRESYLQAIEEEGLTPLRGRGPEIQPPDLENHQPYSYKATVPLEPQVTLGEYTGLTVERPILKVTDEIIERRIDALLEERARLERVTDRGIAPGDVVIAENQVVVEGEEGDPQPPRRQLIQLGSNIPGFDEAIMGQMPGEERTFELTYPDDYDEEDKRGKKVTYTVKVSSISGKRRPELNDEFAQTVGGGDTVEELRANIRQRLEVEAEQLSNQIAEQRLFAEILGRSQIYFPEILIREEVEDDLRRLAQELRQRNLTYAQYLAGQGQTAEQHQVQLAQQAASNIAVLLALREISVQEDLQATDEQVDAEFERMLATGGITEDQFDEYRPDSRRRMQVANALIQQRLHDFLFAHNTINAVEQETPPDVEALEEAGQAAAEADPVAAVTADAEVVDPTAESITAEAESVAADAEE